MTLQAILQEKNLSKYRLSKDSGVPWATLSDICSGKTKLSRCNAGTLMKLAKTLELTVEDVLSLEIVPERGEEGTPLDPAYLEANLPLDLQKAIADYMQGEAERSNLLDCLWGELYGSINANMWGGCISQAQAKYLRAKYLYDEDNVND